MNRMPLGTACIALVCLLGPAGCASKDAAMQPPSEAPSVRSAIPEAVPVGPSEFLKTCLTKITSESSEGAKMVAEQSCRDNEALHQGVAGMAIAKSSNRASAGTQGDSLEACSARIPADATVGQRMLADESCKRDQLLHH